jgi:glycine cleavage system transcriptional repressor
MTQHYHLWAFGKDRPGIVASLTKILFKLRCNLEDSSMMRLGSEFGIFLIFTTTSKQSDASIEKKLAPVQKKLKLDFGVKSISAKEAKFLPLQANPVQISVHGFDRPGIVHHVTQTLAKYRCNITDLSTHRTTAKPKPGYIMIIEGEIPRQASLTSLRTALKRLSKTLKATINLLPLFTKTI